MDFPIVGSVGVKSRKCDRSYVLFSKLCKSDGCHVCAKNYNFFSTSIFGHSQRIFPWTSIVAFDRNLRAKSQSHATVKVHRIFKRVSTCWISTWKFTSNSTWTSSKLLHRFLRCGETSARKSGGCKTLWLTGVRACVGHQAWPQRIFATRRSQQHSTTKFRLLSSAL